MIRTRIVLALVTTALLAFSLSLSADEQHSQAAAASNDWPRANDLLAWAERYSEYQQGAPDATRLRLDKVLAFEENATFLCLLGQRTEESDGRSMRYTRLIFLRPNTFLIDTLWSSEPHPRTIERVGWHKQPIIANKAGFKPKDLSHGIVWQETDDSLRDPETKQTDGHSIVGKAERGLAVFQVQAEGQAAVLPEIALDRRGEVWRVSIRNDKQKFTIELPSCYLDAGWISAESPTGESPIARRPLPGGVLPYGKDGVRMIERWDSRYRGGQTPPWDAGTPAEDLKQVVEQELVKPCRTVILGCGSGTNAIYLASKGFDVTAIDVAPTALTIAEEKAAKAGVRVRWILADVLAMPELPPFDFIFDRGCYHNVRYADAEGFVQSLRKLTKPGSRALVLSLNREGPPGVREQHMRKDFSEWFDFEWLRESNIQTGGRGENRRNSWTLMLRRKTADGHKEIPSE